MNCSTFSVGLAEQHVDQVHDAEALAGAVDAGERHPGGLGSLPGIHRFEAIVALGAFARMFLAEVAQEGLVAAGGGFAEAQQGVELAQFDTLALFRRIAGQQHLAHRHHVAQAVGHPGIGGQAVAPGATGFLIVAFHALGQVEVGDEAHVGLVDAHAEGHRGDHDHAFLAQEALLVGVAAWRHRARRGRAARPSPCP